MLYEMEERETCAHYHKLDIEILWSNVLFIDEDYKSILVHVSKYAMKVWSNVNVLKIISSRVL